MSSKSKRILSVVLTIICLAVVIAALVFTFTRFHETSSGVGDEATLLKNDKSNNGYLSGAEANSVEFAKINGTAVYSETTVTSFTDDFAAFLKSLLVEDGDYADIYDAISLSVKRRESSKRYLNWILKRESIEEKNREYLAAKELQKLYEQKFNETGMVLFGDMFATMDAKIDKYLNVRSAPGGSVIGIMYPGSGGNIIGIADGWALITSGNVTGWVSMDYIATGFDIVNAGPKIYATVMENSLYLRSEPDVNSTPLNILTLGMNVNYVSYTAGWVLVEHNGVYGYMYADYIDLKVGDSVAITLEEYNLIQAALTEPAVPVETLPVPVIPTETQPVVVPPVETQPVVVPPVETQPVETQPVIPVETQPVETQPVETQPVETQPVQTEPAPVETSASEPAPTETSETEAIPSTGNASWDLINQIYAQGNSTRAPFYLSDDEIYLLSCQVILEARGCSHEAKLAVANVILNRLETGYWGNTVHSVIYAPGQFAGTTDGLLDSYLAKGPSYDPDAMMATFEACAGVNNVPGCIFFKRATQTTYSYSYYVIIGKQLFYKK